MDTIQKKYYTGEKWVVPYIFQQIADIQLMMTVIVLDLSHSIANHLKKMQI